MIAMIDDAVGRIRDTAADAGLTDNTVQIYTSDHGDHLGEHRLLFKGAEQYDSLTHVPFIWADPKGPSGARSSDLAQTHDIGSTILEHAGLEGAIGMQGQVVPAAMRRTSSMRHSGRRKRSDTAHAFIAWFTGSGGCRCILANAGTNFSIWRMTRAK
jgi:arylsulfatase A-like enzyme